MAYTKIYYHIIWRTKCSRPTIHTDGEEMLYRYIWKTIEDTGSRLYRINSMPDHIHMFVGLSATISLADFMQKIKLSSGRFMKEKKELFPRFDGWAKSYCAITYCETEKPTVIEYIKNQKEHHRKVSFHDELISILQEAHVEYNEEYLLKD